MQRLRLIAVLSPLVLVCACEDRAPATLDSANAADAFPLPSTDGAVPADDDPTSGRDAAVGDAQPGTDLPPGCVPECQLGQRQCVGAQLASCTAGPAGCPSWGPPSACPKGSSCSQGACQCQFSACGNSCCAANEICDAAAAACTPAKVWASSLGGADDDKVLAVAQDGQGNLLVAGQFEETMSLAGSTLTAKGYRDAFVAKYSADGKELWAVAAGGTGYDSIWSVSVDAQDNAYVVGYFEDTATIGGETLTSKGWADIFVMKLAPDGTPGWVKTLGGPGDDLALAPVQDAQGNLYLVGNFEKQLQVGSTTLVSKGGDDVLVAKLSPNGPVLWAERFGGSKQDLGNGVALGPQGEVIITGSFEGSAEFGGTTLTAKGDADLFVARLSASGPVVWAVSGGGSQDDSGNTVAVDQQSGAIYVGGRFEGNASFGSQTLVSDGFEDVLVARLSPNGPFVWASRAGGTSFDDEALAIAVSQSGDPVVAGTFRSSATFGGTTLTSKGSYDLFLARLSAASGSFSGVLRGGGSNTDKALALALDGGYAVVAGYFSGTSDLGGLSVSCSSSVWYDGFVWRTVLP